MKRTDFTQGGTRIRMLLGGMIMDTEFLRLVSKRWTPEGLFGEGRANCNTIGKWCVDYYENHNKAPGKAIQGLFEDWASYNRDDANIEIVASVLKDVSDQWAANEVNLEYLCDLAEQFFYYEARKKAFEDGEGFAAAGKWQKANTLLDGVQRFGFGGSTNRISLLEDQDAWRKALRSGKEPPLVLYDGGLENFFGKSLCKDAFITFMAPEKRGKTFTLIDLACRAMLQGRRVAYFELGDMSEEAVMLRFGTRLCKHPLKGGKYELPVEIELPEVRKKTVTAKALSEEQVLETIALTAKRNGKDLLRLYCHSAGSVTMDDIRTELEEDEQEQGWVPEVIVLDYADLIAPVNSRDEARNQVNKTWMALRRMSTDLHCLVVTATQTNAASYKEETLKMSSFSEDKRKLSHVTGAVGLNTTDDEKRQGLMRWNWIVRREDSFDPGIHCHVAGCLAIANPAVLSTFH